MDRSAVAFANSHGGMLEMEPWQIKLWLRAMQRRQRMKIGVPARSGISAQDRGIVPRRHGDRAPALFSSEEDKARSIAAERTRTHQNLPLLRSSRRDNFVQVPRNYVEELYSSSRHRSDEDSTTSHGSRTRTTPGKTAPALARTQRLLRRLVSYFYAQTHRGLQTLSAFLQLGGGAPKKTLPAFLQIMPLGGGAPKKGPMVVAMPGPMGEFGENGLIGATGEDGPPGVPGGEGGPGVAGVNGGSGQQGDVGNRGPAGKTGVPGAPGERGIEGHPGTGGVPGRAGNPGPAGKPGPMGPLGPPGVAGPAGFPGSQGDAGMPGELLIPKQMDFYGVCT